MKRYLILAMAGLMGMAASAQVVSSYSYASSKSSTLWYARLGLTVNNVTGGDMVKGFNSSNDYTEASFGSRAGFAVDFGFHRPISDFGLYWGMELGIGTRGTSYKVQGREDSDKWIKGNLLAWNVKYSPFTLGYKYSVTDDLKLDAHLGIYASYDFAGTKMKMEDSEGEKWDWDVEDDWDYLKFDAGIQAGIGIWWKRFNLDFTYQRGFVPMCKPTLQYGIISSEGYFLSSGNEEYKLYSSNFMIRLGVAF